MDLEDVLGREPAMRALAARLSHVIKENSRRLPSLLIEGETGTGKSLLAQTLHDASTRSKHAFISLNCANVSKDMLESELFGYERGAFTGAAASKRGLIEAAHRGTLFLDEIGQLELPQQAKLLCALEERRVRRLGATQATEVDVWLVTATNADLEQACRDLTFLDALFHRIAVVRAKLLPLRERPRDLQALAESLLVRMSAQYGCPKKHLSSAATEALRGHSFPGNIRELSNLLERATALYDEPVITPEMLDLLGSGSPASQTRNGATPSRRSALEIPQSLLAHLAAENWNVSRTARKLGIPRTTLRAHIDRYGIRRGPVEASDESASPLRPPLSNKPQRRFCSKRPHAMIVSARSRSRRPPRAR